MQGPRQAKRILNYYRKVASRGPKKKRNGGYGWIDDYLLERLFATSKRRYRRNKEKVNAKDSSD